MKVLRGKDKKLLFDMQMKWELAEGLKGLMRSMRAS